MSQRLHANRCAWVRHAFTSHLVAVVGCASPGGPESGPGTGVQPDEHASLHPGGAPAADNPMQDHTRMMEKRMGMMQTMKETMMPRLPAPH